MAKNKPSLDEITHAEPRAETQGGYTVLARRYRPQTFGELVGQEPVTRGLINALTSDRVAHAYLFTGARGVGKTSTARILAKALNCVNGPTATPCGVCDICRDITTGEDVDVIELDAASNNGVEEIRNLRNNVQYMPSRARYKIYIIDEIHMLSKQAFNALLKTLEEPPPHVKFIFATTDAHKIPVTILSRCQRFDLSGIGLPQIVERLTAIVKAEGLQADQDALEMIAPGRAVRCATPNRCSINCWPSAAIGYQPIRSTIYSGRRAMSISSALRKRSSRGTRAQPCNGSTPRRSMAFSPASCSIR